MVETFLVSLGTLLVALYIQARRSAQEIRRNRESQIGMVRSVIRHPDSRR